MPDVLVDSNILLDVVTDDPQWVDWSSQQLALAANQGQLVINPIIYAEISVGFDTIEEMEQLLKPDYFQWRTLPREAAFLAGKCFLRYRRAGGVKRSPLPDFLIGAHAAVEKYCLLTRDTTRYRSYFPSLTLISPDCEQS